jgi:hypothetical protein
MSKISNVLNISKSICAKSRRGLLYLFVRWVFDNLEL